MNRILVLHFPHIWYCGYWVLLLACSTDYQYALRWTEDVICFIKVDIETSVLLVNRETKRMRSAKHLETSRRTSEISFIKTVRHVIILLLFFSGLASADVVGEMNYIQIDPVVFSLEDESVMRCGHTSSVTRLWYAHFQADEDYETKPLFVFLNGGPGCGTSMNLFSMNTAPYTLDRNRMSTNDLYQDNPHSWTKLGNLLYIDAPNTGYSYMLSKVTEGSYNWFHLWEFLNGDNFHPLIDAAQVLRAVLQFLDSHPTMKANDVIMVGESYSGVRVSTMLNMLLYHQTYANGSQVYHDEGLVTAITNHFKTVLNREPPFSPEDVASQFGKQILIQPQIVDTYQGADMYARFEKPDSDIARLGYDAHATQSWDEYLSTQYGGTCSLSAVRGYLTAIDRDPYHVLQEANWTDDNEYFSMKRLNNYNALEVITGNCSPSNVPDLFPAARTNALKFALAEEFVDSSFVKWLVQSLCTEDQIKMLETMVPGWRTGQIDMDYDPDALKYKLGELSGLDAYVTGTNPYIFFGFMMNGGGYTIPMLAIAAWLDPYDISADSSDRYGKMFLENLAIVDTFMTDAKYDYVVYSPTLPSQFQGSRFSNYVDHVTTSPGDDARRYGSFTVDYKENAIHEIQQTPDYRTVSWRYYGDSGHAVSASQPEEFRDDVAFWLQSSWYNVYPREGGVTGGTEVTIYGKQLCLDSNDLQSVTINGMTASVLSASSGQITFLTPALPQGASDVVVQSSTYGTITATNAFCAKLPQTISVHTPLESTCYGINEAITCSATSSVASLPVTFSVDTTDPVDGLTNGATSFSMPATGIATIRFEQPGSDEYFAAEPVIRHIAVTSDAPRVYYVTMDGDDANHGLTWSQAKRTPQGAVNSAGSGDTILVSNGVYNVGEAVHYGNNRVVLTEEVTMRSVNGPEQTIIDGSSQTRGVYMKVDTHLEGFTIRNGQLSGSPSHWKERAGAGVFASQRATITHCIIQSNTIALTSSDYGYGGGVCMENDVKMSHCSVLDNSMSTSGANALGGGITIAASATNCLIDNTVIAGNTSLHEGGGLYLDENSHGIHLYNCTLTGNQANDYGSGIYAYGSGHTFNNSIIYGNTGAADLYLYSPDTIWYTNSCVPATSGHGHFVNALTNDPHLLAAPRGMIASDSPCRDQGANSLNQSSTDAGYRPRIIHDIVDIGAYEYQRWLLTSVNGDILFPDQAPAITNGTDFGTIDFGAAMTNEICLKNVSTDTLSVNIVLRGDDFDSFTLCSPAQLTLAANSMTTISFAFLANRAGTNSIELCFTDFDLTSFVTLRGIAKDKSTLSSPANLSFACDYNYREPEPQTFSLTNFGPSDCTWTLEASADWMHTLPESVTIPVTNALTNLIAYVVPGELPTGTYISTNRFVSPAACTVTQLVSLTISRGTATILIDGDHQQYSGAEKAITVTTIPPDLPVTTTYNGTTNLPINVGTYAVTTTIDTVNYSAEETGILTIEKGSQAIAFNQSGLIDARFGIDLSATASSGLPVSFRIHAMTPSNEVDRATIYNGYQLRFQMEAAWAELQIIAAQEGDANWTAQVLTNTFYASASQSFSSWADAIADPTQRGLTNCPAGDGIPNLLKYALGLNPEQVCSQNDVYTYKLATNAMGEQCLQMTYQLSTKTENIQAGPVKTASLLSPNWVTNGIVNTAISTIEAYELWESTLSTASTNAAYMRLKVKVIE